MINEMLSIYDDMEIKYRSEIEVNGIKKFYYTIVTTYGNKKFVCTFEVDETWPYHERLFCITTLENKQ